MKYVACTVGLLLLLGCSKEPGEGGKAEIRGRVMEQDHNANGVPNGDPYLLMDKTVFIIYGDASDGAFPDDNVDTGPYGEVRFKWLRKGSYTVYVVSDCDDCDGGKKTVFASVEVGDRKEVVDAGTLLVEKH